MTENYNTINRPLSERQRFFAQWLLYERSLKELQTDSLFKDLYDDETTPTGKAKIVHLYIMSFHINELFALNDMTIKDILNFAKHKDYLKKFDNETGTTETTETT